MQSVILVTGGSGLVGKAMEEISDLYPNYNFIFLHSKICDLTNYSQSLEVFQKIKPDYVIHLAANVGGLFKNMNNKVEMFEDNMLMNVNVLKICHQINVKKLISCLSTCIFPDKIEYPIDETMLHNGPPHFSNDAYAYSKRMLDVLSMSYQSQYNKDFKCIIPTNIYGKYDNFHLENAHVIPALIHKCYLAKNSGKKFVVSGSGKPLRQFIYSKDLAKLIMWSLLEYKDKESIILSVDEEDEISIKDIATMIAKKMNYEYNLEFDTDKSDGQYKKTVSNKKLRNYLPDFKFIDIQNGINESVEWFIQNYDNIRK